MREIFPFLGLAIVALVVIVVGVASHCSSDSGVLKKIVRAEERGDEFLAAHGGLKLTWALNANWPPRDKSPPWALPTDTIPNN